MRIGHYAPDIWAQGGIASYIQRLGKAQHAAGHEVFYFSKVSGTADAAAACVEVEHDEDLFRQAHALGLDVLHLHKEVSVLPPAAVPTVRTMHGNQASCLSGTRYLGRWEKPCDRVYSIPGCLWGRFVEQCSSRNPRMIRSNFERIRKELRVLPALQTITVSRFLKDQMVRAGYEPEKIHVLHSPAPEVQATYTPPPQQGVPRFVFLGRIVPQKGLAWLLRALAQVEAEVHLDVAGEGFLRTDMERLAERLGLSGRVAFHGWVAPEEVARLIQAARAVVFPSVWHEPAGLVSLEAAAWGRAVIGSTAGGIPEYATREYALLAPPNDVACLADYLTRLAEDRALAERMGRSGMQLVRHKFAMSPFLDRLHQIYALAMSGKMSDEEPVAPAV